MPVLKQAFWERTGIEKRPYRHYVETGSYRGFMIDDVIDEYDVIHSIELSRKWYHYCREKFSQDTHVHLYEGDSQAVLPLVLENIDEPAVIFLDAHYSGGTTARGEEDTPLLKELDIVGRRHHEDIIIIDDTSFLGSKGGSEPTEPVSDDDVWPAFVYDWSNTTAADVLARLRPGYALLTNEDQLMTSSPREDQFIFHPGNDSQDRQERP